MRQRLIQTASKNEIWRFYQPCQLAIITSWYILVEGEETAVIKVDRPDSGVYLCSLPTRQRREESPHSVPLVSSPATSVRASPGTAASLSCIVSGPGLWCGLPGHN